MAHSKDTGRWDLSALPGARAAPERIKKIRNLTGQFKRSGKRLGSKTTHSQMHSMVAKIEKIGELFGELGAHASLSYAADTQSEGSAARVAAMSRLGAQVENEMLFFDQWWKLGLDERNARRLLGGLGDVREYFEHMRLDARHTLSEQQEQIINIMGVTGASAMARLYDTITSGFEYRIGTRRMGREELGTLVRSPRATVRRAAYKALLSKFAANRAVLGDIYTNVVSEWGSVEVGLRSHKSAISVRNMGNNIDDQTVSSLLDACKKNASVFQRFFRVKAKMLGRKRLRRYDLYAPISRPTGRRSYSTALKSVLGAMSDFDPKMATMAKKVADENHIDSSIRKGKRDGAFCSTVSPQHTPYVLLSFAGTQEDVFTLAHELGHAVHSIAASSHSMLVQHAPLPVSETASTFSEMLLHDRIMREAPQAQRRMLLAAKLDSLYATIARQSFFTMFEINAHKLVSGGASAGELSSAYMENLRAQFGRSVEITDDFAGEWAAIPHFYHAPFYCYAYSFGNLMALSLFSRYRREGAGFAQTYLDILAAGGSQKPEDLMAGHGFKIRGAAFWQEGFDYVADQLGTLERM